MVFRRGSGNRTTESRSVANFNRISILSYARVRVFVGKPQSIVVEIDDNLFDLISTEVSGNKLIVLTREGYSSDEGLEVRIEVDKLDYLDVTGSSDVTLSDVQGTKLTISVEGGAHVEASGQVEREDIIINGHSSGIDSVNLTAKEVHISINGFGNVKVNAIEQLNVSINGNGNIRYVGNPQIEKRVNGVGSVQPV